MPTTRDIERMRITASAKLPTVAVIYRRIDAKDAYGKTNFTYEQFCETKCRVWAYSSKEPAEASLLRESVKFAFPANLDVRSTDQIEANGQRFAVIGLIVPKSYEITREVEAKLI
jgi:hypothetical protein